MKWFDYHCSFFFAFQLCANCRQHLGWKFVATKNNYLPKSFYGLSGNSIQVKSVGESNAPRTGANDDDDEDEDEEMLQQQQQRQQQQQQRQQQRQRQQHRRRQMAGDDDTSETDEDVDVVYEVIDMDPNLANAAGANAAVQAAPVLLLERIDDDVEGEEEETDEERFHDARE